MASSTISPATSFFINKDLGSLCFSSASQFSINKCKKSTVPEKIMSVMAPQQSERRPAATGSVKTTMTMTEKILARASEKTQLSAGDNVWVNVDVSMIPDGCGPGSIGTFKKEFGKNAKVWDCEKVVIIPDRHIFPSDERANRNVDILRDFCTEQNIRLTLSTKVYAILHLPKKVTAGLERSW
ncbi:3-isopropylmalate dehydratase large subunit-like [Melia azedarach]|uniref:3-isopropylmalate dehydratase large subunit-like n=2 Tax=Melia azedarach TaxID=155640 RepID=A0ACC1YEF1_MELAZ|nr:3-isopropylmalate dehydratase large subunit-like [Melia azedarach]KAJ4721825.1 3-isopropylmalate dehydratase large subunit-like [Melia azedarach]